DELFLVKVRYKVPRGEESALVTFPVRDTLGQDAGVTTDFQFASSVAGFGMLLRKSDYIGEVTYDDIIAAANASRGADEYGYRAEFVNLVRNAAALADGG
ncbi:MAG: DUF3520 domain-containing protein, partial [Candidatus Hydrogenedentes bacterium]|nr:DUF3520 domain-containing protein [Candidatus Hydrogenedentota bacterium]